jgi:DNA-binding IclR family transcriptional regulator
MPTPVPALDRAMLIINHLSTRPLEAQSLSQVAQATGIHKATAAAVLNTLMEHGLLRRTDRKLYVLGPEFVRLGDAYLQRHPGYPYAKVEMVRLSDAVKLSCSISVVDGDDYIVVDAVGDPNPPHLPTRLGRRFPLAPPFGSVFKVWGPPEEINTWMRAMADEFGTDHDRQLATISAIRTRGYALGGEQEFDVHLDAALRRIGDEHADLRSLRVAMMVADKVRNYDSSLSGDDDEPVNFIVAPIFDPDQRVRMSMNLYGLPGEVRRKDVDRHARRLVAATTAVTRAIGGSAPTALDAIELV